MRARKNNINFVTDGQTDRFTDRASYGVFLNNICVSSMVL